MLELPEAAVIAKQINSTLKNKTIKEVIPVQNPNKLAWFVGDPKKYPELLVNKKIDFAQNHGGILEIALNGTMMTFSDGVNLRFIDVAKKIPKKHQLLIAFQDDTYLCASIQMYGGICCFLKGEYDNEYYKAAIEKPSPLADDFSYEYFEKLLNSIPPGKYSSKAFLATEQRIPGLGNGCLQDILFKAKIHPKRKMNTLLGKDHQILYDAIKSVLKSMIEQEGRDTEKDLFGNPGQYKTILSRNTVGTPCPVCNSIIEKMNYMGGSVYVCSQCQQL